MKPNLKLTLQHTVPTPPPQYLLFISELINESLEVAPQPVFTTQLEGSGEVVEFLRFFERFEHRRFHVLAPRA